MEEKSCENCRTSPPQWECTEERVEKQKMTAGDCVQWSPDYNTIESQLSAANEEKEVLKEALEKIAKLDFNLPGTGEECVACVRIVSDYAMKILKESCSRIEVDAMENSNKIV